jgi:hypothetical protein
VAGLVVALDPHMQDTIAQHRPAEFAALALAAGLVVGGVTLSGCSTAESTLTLFADPGKYEYYNCEQLAGQRKLWSMREQELRLLMDKAEQSSGGAVVNVLAYKADHVAASEELKLVELAARSKNCQTPANWGSNSAIR